MACKTFSKSKCCVVLIFLALEILPDAAVRRYGHIFPSSKTQTWNQNIFTIHSNFLFVIKLEGF